MSRLDLTTIEGYEEFTAKVKRLPDKVKRTEVLKIQRRAARPVQKNYAAQLPKDSGTLSRSVAIRSLSSRRSGGNPVVIIRPGKRGKNNAYYQFMVIRKGDLPGSTNRGSRIGLNTVVADARNRALQATGSIVALESEKKIAQYMQKRINAL